jgi:hypothetical protein
MVCIVPRQKRSEEVSRTTNHTDNNRVGHDHERLGFLDHRDVSELQQHGMRKSGQVASECHMIGENMHPALKQDDVHAGWFKLVAAARSLPLKELPSESQDSNFRRNLQTWRRRIARLFWRFQSNTTAKMISKM